MFGLPGNGRNREGSESQVLRPITTGWPRVVALKCAMSSDSRHGIAFPAPITPSGVCAQISPTFTPPQTFKLPPFILPRGL
jgi:hypothetical protein